MLNLCEYFLESLLTFLGILILLNIPQYLQEHSPESLRTFPGIFTNIPRNPLEHCPESFKRFPEILVSIPRIPFLVPVFLVLWIAIQLSQDNFYGLQQSVLLKNVFLNLKPKKVVFFPDISRVKLIFYHLPARIVECLSQYIFLTLKKEETKIK